MSSEEVCWCLLQLSFSSDPPNTWGTDQCETCADSVLSTNKVLLCNKSSLRNISIFYVHLCWWYWLNTSLTICHTLWLSHCYVQLDNVYLSGSHDSTVGIATGYRLEDSAVGVQVPVQWALGTLSPGLKQPGRQPDHSAPTSARSRKCGGDLHRSR